MSHNNPNTAQSTVVVRMARHSDEPALRRLAALDSSRPPAAPALVVETNGELVAALALSGGPAVADPFRLTADLVGLLELRAAQIATGGSREPMQRRSLRALAPAAARH